MLLPPAVITVAVNGASILFYWGGLGTRTMRGGRQEAKQTLKLAVYECCIVGYVYTAQMYYIIAFAEIKI